MKTIVVQVDIGRGSLLQADIAKDDKWATTNELDENRLAVTTYAMPSVREYCDKYGYDYMLVTEPHGFKLFDDEIRNLLMERYANLYHPSYDRVVYIDNDIMVMPWAPALPDVDRDGVYCVDESHEQFGRDIILNFRKEHPVCDANTPAINSGWLMMNMKTAKLLQEYMLNRNEQSLLPQSGNCKFYDHDQGLMAEFFVECPNQYVPLDQVWNYVVWPWGFDIPQMDDPISERMPFFVHPVGIRKLERYKFFSERIKNIENERPVGRL